ncbi:unnamed protein product [Didymodactylos carnosus]|uniref:Uncharacterized protein n=1 Tax=Didymodactylos carnosus TaxID=1234261 RepID=A0A814WGK2_9BILA|nr:unnamed protein product [Didymodactylos carnosus]CAF1198238.1 unnamed protein product [Didymodactylos carnosus]CAF3866801.1 unnamed protein product [Didymodactylos carnosus]CAF3962610.1 unnamed protein product [Didymodactylos carnosus]
MSRGGRPRGSTRGGGGNRGNGNSSVDVPQKSISQQQTAQLKSEFSIAPLVLEGLSSTRIELNKLIVTQLPEEKLSDIQLNRNNGSFTLYAADVKSFNLLLNGASKLRTGSEQATIRIPRSIQRILNMDKDAFVKNVDLDIEDDDIRTELSKNGFNVEKLSRLQKRGNTVQLEQ